MSMTLAQPTSTGISQPRMPPLPQSIPISLPLSIPGPNVFRLPQRPRPAPASRMAQDRWGALMTAGHHGDARAYKTLLGEIAIWLTCYFSRRLPPAMVENATQDTLLAIHTRRHTYEPGRLFGPWMAGIARHKWIDQLRAMSRQPSCSLDDDLVEEPRVADHGSSVISGIVLRALMAQLKPAQAEAIRLVKLRGFSIEEAARITGQSSALVKVNIHRGIARLSAMAQQAEG
jgi:RNA polymerase sigma factor (sigma-70 family)